MLSGLHSQTFWTWNPQETCLIIFHQLNALNWQHSSKPIKYQSKDGCSSFIKITRFCSAVVLQHWPWQNVFSIVWYNSNVLFQRQYTHSMSGCISVTQVKAWKTEKRRENYTGRKEKARRVRDRGCVYDNTSISTIPSLWKKINLTFLGQHKLKHQRCAASCEAKHRLRHRWSNVMCLYWGSR